MTKTYYIDGENESFSTLSDVRDHCELMNDTDRKTMSGSMVLRTKNENDECEFVGYIHFVKGKCVISKNKNYEK